MVESLTSIIQKFQAGCSAHYDPLRGECSGDNTYSSTRVSQVLLQEYICAPDSSLDITTSTCGRSDCSASCQADGEISSFTADTDQDYLFNVNRPGYFEHTVTDQSKVWIKAGDFIGFTGDIAFR